jgi:hypothetical protein
LPLNHNLIYEIKENVGETEQVIQFKVEKLTTLKTEALGKTDVKSGLITDMTRIFAKSE